MSIPVNQAKKILQKLNIPKDDWISPKVEVKNSLIEGKGSFAKQDIKKGEIVIIWGAKPKHLFSSQEIQAGKAREKSICQIEENLYIGGEKEESTADTDLLNHSCDSNLWMNGPVTLVARKNIKAGEELTADYALWSADTKYQSVWQCRCGSRFCRIKITGNDWKKPQVQKRYRGHFMPFINNKIARLSSNIFQFLPISSKIGSWMNYYGN